MRIVLVLATGLLVACASSDKSAVSTAATTPLADLNLVSTPIPDVLRQAQRAPYAVPAVVACEALAADLKALDAVLGPDLDDPAADEEEGDRGAKLAADALQDAAKGVIPFRGWVRKLTGAERQSRRVAAAVAAGTARRAFLKGFAKGGGCP